MTPKRFFKYLINTLILGLCLIPIIKLAGPNILKQYITYGIGDCKSIPILCRQPEDYVFEPEINKEYLGTLVPYTFPKMSISVPKRFNIIQELIKKDYYKKRHANHKAVIFLLYQEPKTFIKLYPDVQKQGIMDNYEFMRHLTYANFNQINNLTDAFFVIMKSVFTPDIGNQNIAKMIKFKLNQTQGFINYTLAKPDNYFDCNIIDQKGNFFKVYIKDIGGYLDLNNVFAIISTLKPLNNQSRE
ncbi:MAG: hypothetical protein WCY09_01405 [Candidatus Omnitrophota bacterium]